MMEITVFIEQAANFVRGSHGTPAIVDAFAGEGEMKTEINFGMGFGVVGDFREPWTGDHDAGGIDRAGFERLNGSGVDGVGFAKIVGMDDEELGVRWVAKFFDERFWGALRAG